MYTNIADIEKEIAILEEEKGYQANYWFTLGETDRDFDLKPQHSDDYWYMLGWNDREHQIEIGVKLELVEHF